MVSVLKKLFQRYRTFWIWTFRFSIICILLVLGINLWISHVSSKYCYASADESPSCYTGIVLGAMVHARDRPSFILQDRLEVAYELYSKGKIKRFLLSGDHGRKDYDEVNSMKEYLQRKGVPAEDIFLDHAGFDTYNTMVRAKEIFGVTDAVVVTQDFHLERAIYLARTQGLKAFGVASDRRVYRTIRYLYVREVLARMKAFGEVFIGKDPVFYGEKIPITGDSRKSHDS